MKDYIKNHLSPNTIIITSSIFLYSVGFFIHNYYLATFKVANFDLFKGRYVYTGISFFIIASFSVFIQSFNLSFSDPKINFKWKYLFLWLFRFEALVLVTYTLVPGKEALLFDDTDISIFGLIKLSGDGLNNQCHALSLSFFIWIMFLIRNKLDESKEKAERFEIFTAVVQFIPVTFVVIWGLIFDKLITNIFWFNIFIFCSIFGRQFGSRIGESTRLSTGESPIFRDKISPIRKGNELKLLLGTIIFIGFIASMAQYAKYLYAILPSNFGGAKPNSIQITCSDNKTIEGELIDASDKEYVVFNSREQKITIINKGSVITSEIKLNPRKQK